MHSDRGLGWLRLVILVLAASMLALSSFGLGIGIGARTAPAASASASSQEVLVPGTEGQHGLGAVVPTQTPAVSFTPAIAEDDPLDVELFTEAWELLQEQFYGSLPAGKEVTYDAIRGVVDRLDDEHTAFVDPSQAELFEADMEGQFEGIGARVDTAEGGGVELKFLFPGQPAEKAGLRVGDVIIAVDGKDVTGMDLIEAIGLIRGPRESKVTLTIRRGDEKAQDITVVRARIEIPVIETKPLADGKVQYIALSEFSNVAPRRLASAVEAALDKKPVGIILDLRNNPGGLLDAAVRIGSAFVPDGNILIERTKGGGERIYKREGRYLLGKTPLVVLINENSASASEIVAGAIQDAGTGVLMGETTFGKGSVQLPNRLSDGSQLRITIARWFTPKDRDINKAGLEPDIRVPLTQEDLEAQRDPQLDRAVEYLLTGK